eukprot:TRINITY_DN24920_c0_g1_i1.p1 TRINITY_DN24920_c0_g1~~TRINITY_DN24920_c0_g1_i1.p1  ORF type:complete len:157 (-),score=43.65 TRINITY_DN24920_c0_g1_i1:38-508(-)
MHETDERKIAKAGVPMLETDERKNAKDNQEQVKRNFFSVKAAAFSLFVPCVVGKKSYTFLLTSLTSFSVRTLAFLLSLLLAYCNTTPAGTFLFHCVPQMPGSPHGAHYNITPCYSLSACFGSQEDWTGQKVRVCGDEDYPWMIILGAGVASWEFFH